MRRRLVLFLIYLVLLVASHVWRATRPEPATSTDFVTVDAVDLHAAQDAGKPRQVRLAYREHGAETTDAPVLLWLHGSPGSRRDFTRLAPHLEERFRIIAPDLPGFGQSTHGVPDYSLAAHARYALALLDRLDLSRVHVLGFSMGGGVALELYDLAPERVASLTLLSAIGVQELELLGNYHVNHALHALQLGGLWLLYEGVPHFGLFDGWMLDLPYARNFYDSDQRPLRGILERLAVPTLIVHGEHDILVPSAAAREHHRLVPQSELQMLDSDHFMVFRGSPDLAATIGDFITRVEDGTATSRADASEQRISAASGPPGLAPRANGLALFVWGVLLAVATLVSEDLTCVAAGLLVAQGRISFIAASVACAAGIFLGDLMLYLVGRLGSPWLSRRPLSWFLSAREVERSREWFEERGGQVILLSRFLPGTRLPTYFAAGMLRLPMGWFAIRLFVPVALWTPLLVALSWWLGDRFLEVFEGYARYAVVGFIVLLLLIWTLLSLGRSLATWRGRRLLVGWWRRKRSWEFWPPWFFYPPVALYVLWLGIRYRSLTLFTASNPGMPDSGFIGESKHDILTQLDPRWVARFRLIPPASPDERLRAVEAFMTEEELSFPVVLKPDVGQRGSGVVVARDIAQVETYVTVHPDACLVQEYVAGPEFGLFYVRLPGEERGRIFSITEKLLPVVIGDGRATLEELILRDDRAVAMASAYFSVLEDRLHKAPAVGESVRLVELGTHCRGAIFLDGWRIHTPDLEETIDRVSWSFEGFYFGRFDVRTSSIDALSAGRDFKVLELNGVTSEATHIYDPQNSLLTAYRVLFEQWRLAFEIGHRNRQRGVRPTSIGALWRAIVAFVTAPR